MTFTKKSLDDVHSKSINDKSRLLLLLFYGVNSYEYVQSLAKDTL